MCRTTGHKSLPITATKQSGKRVMAINRERDHVAESSEEVSMYVGREGRKQGALEGQRRLGPLSCPGRAAASSVWCTT